MMGAQLVLRSCLERLLQTALPGISPRSLQLKVWQFLFSKLRSSFLQEHLLPLHTNGHPLLWSLGCSVKIFHQGHHLLAAHWTSMPDPTLDFWRQDIQKLFQHQQLQNLLLSVHLGLKPLPAELSELGECLLGSRHLLITKPSKALAGELRIRTVFLYSRSPFLL